MTDEQRKKNSKKKFVKKKSIFRTRTISIRSRRYSTLKLKGLTLGGMEVLEKLQDVDISAREFTVQVIHHHLTSPELSIDELRAAPDRFLARVAAGWAEHEDGLDKKLPEDQPPFDAFKQAASEILSELAERYQHTRVLLTELRQSIPKITLPNIDTSTLSSSFVSSALSGINLDNSWVNRIVEHLDWVETFKTTTSSIDFKWLDDMKAAFNPSSLENFRAVTDALGGISIQSTLESVWKSASGFASVTEQVSQSLQEIVGSLQPTFDISNLIQNLPSPAELIRQWEETRQAEEALQVSGYGFSAHLWEAAFVIGFARVSPKVRAASVTNKLLALTRSSEFAEALTSSIKSSPTLMRRQRVILRAFEAHKERDYVVSVPLLLSQLEGIVGDMLRLRGLVALKGGKVYAKDADGKIKLNKKGEIVELKGLGPLIQHSDWRSHPVLDRAADLLTTQLIGDRNEILHGRRTSYSSAKLSTQALLLLLVLAREIAAFEKTKITPST